MQDSPSENPIPAPSSLHEDLTPLPPQISLHLPATCTPLLCAFHPVALTSGLPSLLPPPPQTEGPRSNQANEGRIPEGGARGSQRVKVEVGTGVGTALRSCSKSSSWGGEGKGMVDASESTRSGSYSPRSLHPLWWVTLCPGLLETDLVNATAPRWSQTVPFHRPEAVDWVTHFVAGHPAYNHCCWQRGRV